MQGYTSAIFATTYTHTVRYKVFENIEYSVYNLYNLKAIQTFLGDIPLLLGYHF